MQMCPYKKCFLANAKWYSVLELPLENLLLEILNIVKLALKSIVRFKILSKVSLHL